MSLFSFFEKAMTLFKNHDWHMVSFFAKKSVTNSGKVTYHYDTFATPGFGQTLVGEKNQRTNFHEGILGLIQEQFEKG